MGNYFLPDADSSEWEVEGKGERTFVSRLEVAVTAVFDKQRHTSLLEPVMSWQFIVVYISSLLCSSSESDLLLFCRLNTLYSFCPALVLLWNMLVKRCKKRDIKRIIGEADLKVCNASLSRQPRMTLGADALQQQQIIDKEWGPLMPWRKCPLV